MLGSALDLTSARSSAWWQSSSYLAADKAGSGNWPPGLAASFRTGQYALTGLDASAIPAAAIGDVTRLSMTSLAALFTFSRASEATCVGADGNLAIAAVDVPRFDFTNGRRQLLLEGPSTNAIRNNTMVGATAGVVGSGGALPANWTASGSGLARTIVGTGMSGGVDYFDIRFQGTTTDGNGAMLGFEGQQDIIALTDERWSASTYVALVAGSLAAASAFRFTLREGTSSGAFVAQNNSADLKAQLASSLKRLSYSATLAGGATTAYLQPRLLVSATSGTALDFTLRVGLPQCEKQVAPTSVIRTSGTALARAADDCRLGSAGNAIIARSAAGLLVKGSGAWGGSGALLGGAAGTRILAFNAGQTSLGIGNTSPLVIDDSVTTPLPNFGLAGGWDGSGRAGSFGSGTPVSDASVMDADLSAVGLGRNDGTAAFASGWYDELAIYPFRPSNAALAALSAAPL
jgi:hypothetical protein